MTGVSPHHGRATGEHEARAPLLVGDQRHGDRRRAKVAPAVAAAIEAREVGADALAQRRVELRAGLEHPS